MNSKHGLTFLATAGIALAAAGCGSSTPSSSTNNATGPPVKAAADAYRFSDCMRSHGVSDFPDPQVVNQPGQQGLSIHITPAITSSPQYAKAQTACAGIMPAGKLQNVSPAQAAQHLETRKIDGLSFARCMRADGVPNFPDPNGQGQLTIQMVLAQGIDVHSASVLAVVKRCLPASHGALTPADVRSAIASAP